MLLSRMLPAFALLLAARLAWPCTQDIECGPGASCVKAGGASMGTCVREVLPQGGVDTPTPPLGNAAVKKDSTCTFDSDCGEGRSCVKPSSNAPGLCVKQ